MDSSGVSNAFRELARVLETLETDTHPEFKITTAIPVEEELLDSDTVSVNVGVRIPFLEEPPEDTQTERTLRATEVALTNSGMLQVDLQATVDQSGESPGHLQNEQASEEDQSDADPKSNATRTPATTEPAQPDEPIRDSSPKSTTSVSTEDAEPANTEDKDENEENAQQTATSEDVKHDAKADPPDSTEETNQSGEGETSVPPYQDPEQLEAVYEEHDTFAEMTDALGVDVTPQTVRRYMIEFDIHEPTTRTGSRLAESLLDADAESLPTQRSSDDTQDTVSPESQVQTLGDHSNGDREDVERHSPADESTSESVMSTDGLGSERKENLSSTKENGSQSDGGHEDETHSKSDSATSSSRDASSPSEEQEERGTGSDSGRKQTCDIPSIDEETLKESVDIDFPSEISLEDIKDAIRTGKTLYDVQHRLGIERERTRDLLKALNLLELVHGRVANRSPHQPTEAEIEERLWNSIAGQTGSSVDDPSLSHARAGK